MNSTMKRYFCGRRGMWILLGIVFAAVPLVAATSRIYVTNRGGTTISVIDPATNRVVETIRGIESPEVVRFSPDGSRLYIANRSVDVHAPVGDIEPASVRRESHHFGRLNSSDRLHDPVRRRVDHTDGGSTSIRDIDPG